jgi:signal transduction histidine kinase
MPSSILNILTFLIPTVLFLFLGFVVLANKRDLTGYLFFSFVISLVAWIVSLYAYITINNIALLQWVGRFNFASGVLLFVFFFFFTYKFPVQISRYPFWFRFLVFLDITAILVLTQFTHLISLREHITDNGGRLTDFGTLYYVYVAHLAIFALASIVTLIRKLKKNLKDIEKTQIKLILWGFLISTILILSTNILLPLLGDFSLQGFGPLSSTVLVVFTAYAIIKYKLLDIRVIISQVLVGVLCLILFFYIFFSGSTSDLIIRIIIFISVLVIGIQIVKNIIKEIESGKKLSKLSSDLELANRRLQKLDKTKSEFLSIASHQLRTPISGIKGYLSMILEGDFGKVEEKPREILQSIYDNTERLNGLVNDFLDVSRIERGKLVMERQETDMGEMVQSIVSNFQPVAANKGLKLVYTPPKEMVPKINIDPNKLRQVILNLVDNAIKYTHSGSVQVSLDGYTDRLRVCVKDTGVGLEPDEAKNLFKPFVRAADASKSNATGSGLGLYVARKIVQYHNGKVWAESEGKGKGSRFCVEVPYDQSKLSEPEPEPYLE